MTPPPAAWVEFGKLLRSIRTEAKLSQDELGKRIDRGRSTVSGYETGHRVPDVADVRAMDDALTAHGTLLRAREAAERTSRSPLWYQQVTEAEKHATEIRMFHSSVVPGRFQVAEYARAVLRDARPLDSAEDIERSVALRLKMLPQMTAAAVRGQWVILPEAVLSARVGGPETMTCQLDHLQELAESGMLRLSVLPSDAPTTGHLSGPFRVISFSDRMPLLYVEHAAGGALIDRAEEVRRMMAVFSDLQAWSLDPSASLAMIEKAKDDL
jgi:transcriptional regulator with XRE-family HTH domain